MGSQSAQHHNEQPDTWHDHSSDEKPQHSHTEVANAPKIISTGLALFALVVASVVVVYGYYMNYVTREQSLQERRSAEGPAIAAEKYKIESLGRQTTGGMITVGSTQEGGDGRRQQEIRRFEDAQADVLRSYGLVKSAAQ